MDEQKLKEARSNLIEKVAEMTKTGSIDTQTLDDLLRSIERIDEMLKSRRAP